MPTDHFTIDPLKSLGFMVRRAGKDVRGPFTSRPEAKAWVDGYRFCQMDEAEKRMDERSQEARKALGK
jgi:hypothetical protein